MAKSDASSESTPELPFEQAIEELEDIVREMESDRLPLDQLVEKYERGHRLLKTCQARIDEAEQRIERITTAVGSGEPGLEPFDPGAAESEDGRDSEDASEAAPARKSQSRPKSKPKASADSADDEIRLF